MLIRPNIHSYSGDYFRDFAKINTATNYLWQNYKLLIIPPNILFFFSSLRLIFHDYLFIKKDIMTNGKLISRIIR